VTASSGPTFDLRLLAVLAILLTARSAAADKEKALEHFDRGNTAYTLGRFEEAIEHFERAYEEHAAPAFIFNIAQAYRQLRDCPKAIFLYRRFLDLSPDAPEREEVLGFIDDLGRACPAPPPSPPPPSPPPPSPPPTAPPPPLPEPPPKVEIVVDRYDPVFSATLEAGAAHVSFGRLTSAVVFRARLSAALPIRIGELWLEPGVSFEISPSPYDSAGQGTAILSDLIGNLTVAYGLVDRLRLRVEVGAGALIVSGLDEGNPFTIGGAPTSGPLSMFSFRAAIGADVSLTERFLLSITPLAFGVSPPKSGLRDEVDRIQRFAFVAGLSVRL
jgi:tetratricopeptide (TPR) repeat protein